MEKDSHCCWLSFASPVSMSVDELEARLGFRGNANVKARARSPRACPSLFESDNDVAVDAPLEDHLAWMLVQCKDHLEKIHEFASAPGHRVELLLMRQTNNDGCYFSFDPGLLAPFINSGVHLMIKYEYYDTEEQAQ